jgi:hypothetical protein
MRIWILFLIKVMQICDHWPTDPPGLHFEPPSLHFERPRPYKILFEPRKILNFDVNADPDLASHSNADPDPAYKNKADPYGSVSETLRHSMLKKQACKVRYRNEHVPINAKKIYLEVRHILVTSFMGFIAIGNPMRKFSSRSRSRGV